MSINRSLVAAEIQTMCDKVEAIDRNFDIAIKRLDELQRLLEEVVSSHDSGLGMKPLHLDLIDSIKTQLGGWGVCDE